MKRVQSSIASFLTGPAQKKSKETISAKCFPPSPRSPCQQLSANVDLVNHILIDERNRMNVSTLNGLLYIAVNGPDVRSFPAQKFAEMWLKEGRHAADDAPTGKPKRPHEVRHQSKLFT